MGKFEWEYNNTGGASITHKGKLYTVLPSMSDGALSAFQDDEHGARRLRNGSSFKLNTNSHRSLTVKAIRS